MIFFQGRGMQRGVGSSYHTIASSELSNIVGTDCSYRGHRNAMACARSSAAPEATGYADCNRAADAISRKESLG